MTSSCEPILEFTCALPKIGIGVRKNEYVLMNNASIWLRFYQTKIKTQFKNHISNWCIPESNLKHKSGRIEYQLYRPSKKRLDADAPSYIYKWTMDTLVSQGWFLDDNDITIVLRPVIVEPNRVETEFKVSVFVS